MKTSLKIAFLFVAIFVMCGCSAQKRAERLVRRAVNLCPELVQMKAHTIDTVLTMPAWADCADVPLPEVLKGDTFYAATTHGTVVVSLRQSDSALRVGFVAAQQEIHYRDTVNYAEVTVEPQPQKGTSFWSHFALCLFGLGLGIALCVWLYSKLKKNTHKHIHYVENQKSDSAIAQE